MPRTWLFATACSLAPGAIFAAISPSALTSAHATEPPSNCPPAFSRVAAPESGQSAQADATAILAQMQLPPGSSESPRDPQEAGSLLAGVATIDTSGCGGVSPTIQGTAEPELEGEWFLVEQISQALGTRRRGHH
jgi:hypothetical protein